METHLQRRRYSDTTAGSGLITVGTNSFGYNHSRNFAGLPFKNVRFKKVMDWYKLPAHWHFKVHGKVVHKYINRFNDLGLNNVDIYHFFNTITPVKKPWVVTFETTVPRLDPDFIQGYEWLAGKYCRKIIAYTKRAFAAEMHQLNRYPQYKDPIASKMMLVYPSQRLMVQDLSDKNFDERIVFTITGSCFFLKGGWELLHAFDRLAKENAPVQLNIISTLEVLGYKDLHATPEIRKKAEEMILANPLIKHYRGLPNSEVLAILKKSHVGILPSYGETFGYSLLEAMACGCAVVATSVPPFPEFVQEDWGTIIPVPTKSRNGLEFTDTEDPHAYSEMSRLLEKGIYEAVNRLVADRNELKTKCENAIERIRTFHNPEDRVQLLSGIYESALTN